MGNARQSAVALTVTRAVSLGRRVSKTTFVVLVDLTMGRLLDTDPVAAKVG